MKTFFFCFLTCVVVSAAPTAKTHQNRHTMLRVRSDQANTHRQSPEKKEEMFKLKSIIVTTENLTKILSEKILNKEVVNVFQNTACSPETLCRAKNVLSDFKAKDLGLEEAKDWRLPRLLRSYTNKTQCTNMANQEEVPLRQLLQQIRACAKEEYTNRP